MAEQNHNPHDAEDTSVEDALAEAKQSLEDVADSIESTQTGGDVAEPTYSLAHTGIDLLSDVDLNVSIELGRTEMLVEDVLKLQNGSVVELDKLAGDPVDVFVNGRLVARGEVLVLNDNFCIRISEIIDNLQEEIEAAAQEQETVA